MVLTSTSSFLDLTHCILHAHQMLTARKIWNIALTWRSGSTLHLRAMWWAEEPFLAGSSLFHTSPRQAPFTWTFTEAVWFKRGAQGQSTGIVTKVMSHCSLWSSLCNTLRRHSTAPLHTPYLTEGEGDAGTQQLQRQAALKRQLQSQESRNGGRRWYFTFTPQSMVSALSALLFIHMSDLHIADCLLLPPPVYKRKAQSKAGFDILIYLCHPNLKRCKISKELQILIAQTKLKV